MAGLRPTHLLCKKSAESTQLLWSLLRELIFCELLPQSNLSTRCGREPWRPSILRGFVQAGVSERPSTPSVPPGMDVSY